MMMLLRHVCEAALWHEIRRRVLVGKMLSACVAAMAVGSAANAQVGPAGPGAKSAEPQTAPEAVKITLAASSRQISPGETFHIAVQFKIHPHWHIYWKNSGATGVGTSVKVTVPDGFVVGETLFPTPRSFDEPEGTTYGYEKSAVLFVPIAAPQELSSESVSLKVTVDYLVCRKVCLIGRDEQSLIVQTNSQAVSVDRQTDVVFTDSRLQTLYERLPRVIDGKLLGATVGFADGELTIVVPADGATHVEFFPNDKPGITFGEAVISIARGVATAKVPVQIKPGNSLGLPLVIAGLVAVGDDANGESYEFQLSPHDVQRKP